MYLEDHWQSHLEVQPAKDGKQIQGVYDQTKLCVNINTLQVTPFCYYVLGGNDLFLTKPPTGGFITIKLAI